MKNRYPTPEELYALERNARALRAAELARIIRAVLGYRIPRKLKGLQHA